MQGTPFVDRERELAWLEARFASGEAELVVLYGRRRVGKTELLRTFCAGRSALFYVADVGTDAAALAGFSDHIGLFQAGRSDALGRFETWEAAFRYLGGLAKEERLVVVLDEFTYLVDANRSLPSVLQRLWDSELRDTKLMLVLCGSYVGLIERQVLFYRAPLYGRRTGQWYLQPLGMHDAARFYPGYSAEEKVRTFAVLGGVPSYVRQIDQRRSLLANIEAIVLTPGSVLYDEPRFVLIHELRDPQRHFSILEAIAAGRTRPNEIAQQAGVAHSSLSFYLDTLREMRVVERVVPATEAHPEKSKLGLYTIADPFLKFWFRFVYPNRSLLERGELGQVAKQVAEQLDQFTGPTFEAICREHVWRLASAGALDFVPRAVGGWWTRRDEVDVVAIGPDHLLVGECKWSAKPIGGDILDELTRRTESVAVAAGMTAATAQRVLFARSGFTPELLRRAEAEGVRLVDLAEILAPTEVMADERMGGMG